LPVGIWLNEILPAPAAVDWDGDGASTYEDEWIELVNVGAAAASLGGWTVADTSRTYTLPLGTVIWPGARLLLFRSQTRLALGDTFDTVSLLRPDGSLADRLSYTTGPGADRSFCRLPDGVGGWTTQCQVTPGQANLALSIPTPRPAAEEDTGGASGPVGAAQAMSIVAARAAPEGAFVQVTGAVTAPPGPFGRSIYIQDETGGVRVYLRRGEYPALALGDRVRAAGWTRRFYGEIEVAAPDPAYLARLSEGRPPEALWIPTGALGGAYAGRLVRIIGRVVSFAPDALTLDDGSSPARVYFPAELSWRRPWVQRGEMWSAAGVVGQYALQPPYEGGYELRPRFPIDVSNAPLLLPVTGSP
jgi:hypothetical protein